MDVMDKLAILAEAAKFDAACTSSGVQRGPRKGGVGDARAAGCCHSFAPDGRCITLLKVLMSNACSYDCAYCVNRRGASCPRATFSPRELAELTIGFYKRNYIEGLFLSSGVLGTPDETTERMIACLRTLRQDYHFNGYIHAKVIPGTSPELVRRLGLLADRLSSNVELPSSASLQALCPDKDSRAVLAPMGQIARGRREEESRLLAQGKGASLARRPASGDMGPGLGGAALRMTLSKSRSAVPNSRRKFAPAGQSTQLIVGASPETDRQILRLSESLYKKFDLKRVFFSAYMPMLSDSRLPEPGTPVPLRREHRLYQADWLMRYYDFSPGELVTEDRPWLDLDLDPKLAWGIANLDRFPIEVMTAPLETLLRVPGIGPVGARRIVAARRTQRLGFDDLAALKITLKRARPFVTCCGRRDSGSVLDEGYLRRKAMDDARSTRYSRARREAEGQLTLF